MGVTSLAAKEATKVFLKRANSLLLSGKLNPAKTLLVQQTIKQVAGTVDHPEGKKKVLRSIYLEIMGRATPATKGDITVISGGQDGVDRMGLEAAQSAGIPTGGTAPPGFVTQSKRQGDSSLQGFGLVEGAPDPSKFKLRTIKNAQDADGTIWFGNPTSAGGRLTLGTQSQTGRPSPLVNPTTTKDIVDWMTANSVRTVNIAGNRPSGLKKFGWDTEKLNNLLRESFVELKTRKVGSAAPATVSPVAEEIPYRKQFDAGVARGDYSGFVRRLKAQGHTPEHITKINRQIREEKLGDYLTKSGQPTDAAHLADDNSTIVWGKPGSPAKVPENILRQYPETERVMVGNHGVYLEMSQPSWADSNSFVKKHIQYNEHSGPRGEYVYEQTKGVNYADYVPNKWYVKPPATVSLVEAAPAPGKAKSLPARQARPHADHQIFVGNQLGFDEIFDGTTTSILYPDIAQDLKKGSILELSHHHPATGHNLGNGYVKVTGVRPVDLTMVDKLAKRTGRTPDQIRNSLKVHSFEGELLSEITFKPIGTYNEASGLLELPGTRPAAAYSWGKRGAFDNLIESSYYSNRSEITPKLDKLAARRAARRGLQPTVIPEGRSSDITDLGSSSISLDDEGVLVRTEGPGELEAFARSLDEEAVSLEFYDLKDAREWYTDMLAGGVEPHEIPNGAQLRELFDISDELQKTREVTGVLGDRGTQTVITAQEKTMALQRKAENEVFLNEHLKDIAAGGNGRLTADQVDVMEKQIASDRNALGKAWHQENTIDAALDGKTEEEGVLDVLADIDRYSPKPYIEAKDLPESLVKSRWKTGGTSSGTTVYGGPKYQETPKLSPAEQSRVLLRRGAIKQEPKFADELPGGGNQASGDVEGWLRKRAADPSPQSRWLEQGSRPIQLLGPPEPTNLPLANRTGVQASPEQQEAIRRFNAGVANNPEVANQRDLEALIEGRATPAQEFALQVALAQAGTSNQISPVETMVVPRRDVFNRTPEGGFLKEGGSARLLQFLGPERPAVLEPLEGMSLGPRRERSKIPVGVPTYYRQEGEPVQRFVASSSTRDPSLADALALGQSSSEKLTNYIINEQEGLGDLATLRGVGYGEPGTTLPTVTKRPGEHTLDAYGNVVYTQDLAEQVTVGFPATEDTEPLTSNIVDAVATLGPPHKAQPTMRELLEQMLYNKQSMDPRVLESLSAKIDIPEDDTMQVIAHLDRYFAGGEPGEEARAIVDPLLKKWPNMLYALLAASGAALSAGMTDGPMGAGGVPAP